MNKEKQPMRKASDQCMVAALRVLAAQIQCDDGIANSACADAADRLEALSESITDIRDAVLHQRHQLAEVVVDNDVINAVLGIIDDHDPRVLETSE
jgi:hypothetical protein